MMDEHYVLGLMSGTSLDGVDLAYVLFRRDEGRWQFEIKKAVTIPYDESWKKKLGEAPRLTGEQLTRLDFDYGRYLGELVADFVRSEGLYPGLVSSHGHTVFHRPQQGYTLQIGRGETLSAACGIPVVWDFRAGDVALGGQGAPLVPMGDELLFGHYAACVNVGGFANISLKKGGKRIAWDIGPANTVLNFVAHSLGYDYDSNGTLAAEGRLIPSLFEQLNSLSYYRLPYPKSLGREWVEENIFPLVEPYLSQAKDLLHTLTVHIARQIAANMPPEGKVLMTGGGVHNGFLMRQITLQSRAEPVIPSQLLIDYKEALIFALLGVLRKENQINILSSVTGAGRSHCGGKMVL